MYRLIAGEFRKLLATRLWLWLLLVAMAVTALYSYLAIAFADNPDNPSPSLASPAGQRMVLTTGANPAWTLLAVLAAIGITGEFRHRTAATTFLATPHRTRVVVAKVVTYALVGVGYAIVCSIQAIAMALPWLASRGIHVPLTGNDIPAAIVGAILAVALFALVGVGLGAMFFEQVATTVGLLIYLFVVEPIVARVGALSSWTIYLPGQAARALTQVNEIPGREILAAWQGGLLLAGYGVALVLVGAFVVSRRDVA